MAPTQSHRDREETVAISRDVASCCPFAKLRLHHRPNPPPHKQVCARQPLMRAGRDRREIPAPRAVVEGARPSRALAASAALGSPGPRRPAPRSGAAPGASPGWCPGRGWTCGAGGDTGGAVPTPAAGSHTPSVWAVPSWTLVEHRRRTQHGATHTGCPTPRLLPPRATGGRPCAPRAACNYFDWLVEPPLTPLPRASPATMSSQSIYVSLSILSLIGLAGAVRARPPRRPLALAPGARHEPGFGWRRRTH